MINWNKILTYKGEWNRGKKSGYGEFKFIKYECALICLGQMEMFIFTRESGKITRRTAMVSILCTIMPVILFSKKIINLE